MQISFINQYAGENLHLNVINQLLDSQNYHSFRSLSAFVTIGGLSSIQRSLYTYLSNGNELNWIIGIDNNITSKEALLHLRALKEEFPEQVNIKIFSAGSIRNIFHPKLFIFENDEEFVVINGSANATAGGLLRNFEISTQISLSKNDLCDQSVINELNGIWDSYNTPLSPMTPENLLDLNSETVTEIINQESTRSEIPTSNYIRPSHPLQEYSRGQEINNNITNNIIEPNHEERDLSTNNGEQTSTTHTTQTELVEIEINEDLPRILIMDILNETRQTQVQLPIGVVNRFFTDLNSNLLYYLNNGVMELEDARPIVVLEHNDTRRIEIRQIRDRQRPLIIRFSRIDFYQNRFVYELIDQSNPEFSLLNNLLATNGNQTRSGSRRWLILE